MVAEVRKERKGEKKRLLTNLMYFSFEQVKVSSQQLYIITPRPSATTRLLASLLPSTNPGISVETTSRAIPEHNILLTRSFLLTAATHVYRINLQMDCTGLGWRSRLNTPISHLNTHEDHKDWPQQKITQLQDDENLSIELGPSHHGGGKHISDHKQNWNSTVQGWEIAKVYCLLQHHLQMSKSLANGSSSPTVPYWNCITNEET